MVLWLKASASYGSQSIIMPLSCCKSSLRSSIRYYTHCRNLSPVTELMSVQTYGRGSFGRSLSSQR